MAIIWTHQAHSLNGLIWRSFLNPRPDRNNTGSPTRRWAQMVQARLITWKYKGDHDTKPLVLQIEFKYVNKLQPNFTIDTIEVQIYKRYYNYSSFHQFWSNKTGQTGPRKGRQAAHAAPGIRLDKALA